MPVEEKIWQVAQVPRDVEHLSKSVKRADLMLSVLTVIKGNTDVNSSPWVIIAFTFLSHTLHHPLSPLPLPSLFLPPQSEPPFYSHAPHLSLFKSKLSMGQCIFPSLINFTPVPCIFLQIPWFHFSFNGWIKFHFIHPACFLCLPICYWPPRVRVYTGYCGQWHSKHMNISMFMSFEADIST